MSLTFATPESRLSQEMEKELEIRNLKETVEPTTRFGTSKVRFPRCESS